MVVHTFNPSTWEAETGKLLRVQGQPGLQKEILFQPTLTQKKELATA